MNAGIFGDMGSITCTTPGTENAFGFVKFNTGHESSSAKVANLCLLETLAQGANYASRGSFMVDSNGRFVNEAGNIVTSSDFESTADTGVSAKIYYSNAVSVWAFLKDKSSSPE